MSKLTKEQKEKLILQAEKDLEKKEKIQKRISEFNEKLESLCKEYGVTLALAGQDTISIMNELSNSIKNQRIIAVPISEELEESENEK